MTRAVVFGYHNVGVQCLSVLLAHSIEVPLVVTHNDDPAEKIWFGSVSELARAHGIEYITPDNPNTPQVAQRIHSLAPDFLFSFYYRHLLKPDLLTIPTRGALNMHGSLLPKYRGRVPVNWAVICGEQETGATLHYMTAQPDAGDIVDQETVTILPDDTAFDVFGKVTTAARSVLDRSLPALVAGNAPRTTQNLARGSYFGGRKPVDGRIDWNLPAARIHNLVRGVAPPYPGAFTSLQGKTLRVLRTKIGTSSSSAEAPALYVDGDRCFAICADGRVLDILDMDLDGTPIKSADLRGRFGAGPLVLMNPN